MIIINSLIVPINLVLDVFSVYFLAFSALCIVLQIYENILLKKTVFGIATRILLINCFFSRKY